MNNLRYITCFDYLKGTLISLFMLHCPDLSGQTFNQSISPGKLNWQYGLSAKLSGYLFNKTPCVRLCLCGGTGTFVFDKSLFPTLHVEYHIYMNGLGTRGGSPQLRTHITTEFFCALSATARMESLTGNISDYLSRNWNQPLYYWSDFATPPLINPYFTSITLSTVLAVETDYLKILDGSPIQRIGFIGGHVHQFDAFYYNDGGPGFTQSLLGDGKDRLNTGGGMIAYHPNIRRGLNNYEADFHKYTGYAKDAFELGDQLDYAVVNYRDSLQQYYNQSEICFRTGNTVDGWAAVVRLMNLKDLKDVQHIIHYHDDYPYHLVPYPWGISFGGDYSLSHSNVYLR